MFILTQKWSIDLKPQRSFINIYSEVNRKSFLTGLEGLTTANAQLMNRMISLVTEEGKV